MCVFFFVQNSLKFQHSYLANIVIEKSFEYQIQQRLTINLCKGSCKYEFYSIGDINIDFLKPSSNKSKFYIFWGVFSANSI